MPCGGRQCGWRAPCGNKVAGGGNGGTRALDTMAALVDGIAVKSRACMEEQAEAREEEVKVFFILTKPRARG
jgi:hypothetical protein